MIGKRYPSLVVLWLLGCEVRLDDKAPELPGDDRFSHSEERCSVPSPASVRFSLAYPEGTYLISADTGMGIALRSDDDPCAAFEAVGSGAQKPVPLLELTADEIAAGTTSDDGYELMLVPRSGFVAEGRGFLYYEKLLYKDPFDMLHVGVGVATLAFGEPAVRLMPNRFISEPSLLWLDSREGRAASAVLGADGFAYVYNVYRLGEFDWRTYVARVVPESIGEASEYRYSVDGEWDDSEERAEPVLAGLNALSVVHDEYLDAYVFVFAGPLSDTVFGRIAALPSGPFGPLQALYEGVPPANFWIRDVTVHAGLGADDGRRLLTSYFSDTADERAGIHLVDVAFR